MVKEVAFAGIAAIKINRKCRKKIKKKQKVVEGKREKSKLYANEKLTLH